MYNLERKMKYWIDRGVKNEQLEKDCSNIYD